MLYERVTETNIVLHKEPPSTAFYPGAAVAIGVRPPVNLDAVKVKRTLPRYGEFSIHDKLFRQPIDEGVKVFLGPHANDLHVLNVDLMKDNAGNSLVFPMEFLW